MLLLALPGRLAAGERGRGKGDSDEVAALKLRLTELRRLVTVGEMETERLRRELDRLSGELAAARHDGAACREELAERPLEPPAAWTEPVEESEVADEELDLLTPPPGAAQVAEEPTTVPAAETAPVDTSPPPTPRPVTPEAQALYDDSYTLFHEKRYAEAEEGFRRFLETHPATSLADNAQFWIGECRYARGEYQAALDAFTGTVERFPDGNKVPDALFKAGRCLEALGDAKRAAETYREVIEGFRGSAAAAAAEDRLSDLDRPDR